jgi:hypothetical protein
MSSENVAYRLPPSVHRRRLSLLPVACGLLLLCVSCQKNVSQFLGHPTVEERMKDNQSLPSQLAPAIANPDSFRFALFGDPQLPDSFVSYLGQFRRDVADSGISFFGVLGDLAEDNTGPERTAVKAGLDSVGVPYLVTIGNHDLYQADGWTWFETTFGASVYSVVVADRLKLIFLDTADGLIGQAQFDWLERELSWDGTKIVGTHYPAYDGIAPIMWRLASAEERYKLTSLLAKYHVHSIVGGHIHGWRHTMIDGVNHFISAMPGVAMDYGRPGYIIFTWAHDSLSWSHVEYDSPPRR